MIRKPNLIIWEPNQINISKQSECTHESAGEQWSPLLNEFEIQFLNVTSFHFSELCRVLGCTCEEFDNNLQLKQNIRRAQVKKLADLAGCDPVGAHYPSADGQLGGSGCLGSAPRLCPWTRGRAVGRSWPGRGAAMRRPRRRDPDRTRPGSLSESPAGGAQETMSTATMLRLRRLLWLLKHCSICWLTLGGERNRVGH